MFYWIGSLLPLRDLDRDFDLDRDLDRDTDLDRLTGDDDGEADIDLEAAAAFFLVACPTPGLDERLRLLRRGEILFKFSLHDKTVEGEDCKVAWNSQNWKSERGHGKMQPTVLTF